MSFRQSQPTSEATTFVTRLDNNAIDSTLACEFQQRLSVHRANTTKMGTGVEAPGTTTTGTTRHQHRSRADWRQAGGGAGPRTRRGTWLEMSSESSVGHTSAERANLASATKLVLLWRVPSAYLKTPSVRPYTVSSRGEPGSGRRGGADSQTTTGCRGQTAR